MCGFAGVVARGGGVVRVAALRAATRRLRHRGPDDEGFLLAATGSGGFREAGGPDTPEVLGLPPVEAANGEGFDLGLGFRRLAVQDPSPAGHQPMGDPRRRLFVAFNGELYNHLALRPELEAAGWRFAGRSDTETLLAAWHLLGPSCLDRFEGMWALAVVDLAAGALTLSRDRFGIKPLYLCEDEEGIAFASEIGALLELRTGAPRVHPASWFRYLRFGITDAGRETLLRGIERLPPGVCATFELPLSAGRRGRQERRFWRPPPRETAGMDRREAVSALREAFLGSVSAHLLSDVPLGVALSGGIDSTAVLAGARHALPRSAALQAFGMVVEDPSIGEEPFMRLAARELGAELHLVRPTARELEADLDRLVRAQDEPFLSTSIYAQYRVFRLAREAGVRVVLGGQGADELLAGYTSHLGARLASLLRAGRLLRALRFARAAAGLPGVGAGGLWLRAGADLLPPALDSLARRLVGEELAPPWLDGAWFRARGVRPAAPRAGPGRERLRARLALAFGETSLPMLLRFEDRNAMAWSVESRVPFLSRPVVELLARVPEEWLVDDTGRTKALFRDAMRGLVPEAILARRDKIGFVTPEARWMGELAPLARKRLIEAAPVVGGLRVEPLLEAWGRPGRHGGVADSRSWRGLNAVLWACSLDVRFD